MARTDDSNDEAVRISWKSIKLQLYGMPGVFIAVMLLCSIPGAVATYVMWKQTFVSAEIAAFLGDKFDDMADTVRYEHEVIRHERMKDQCVALYDFKERKAIRETLSRDGLQSWCTWLPPNPIAPTPRRPHRVMASPTRKDYRFPDFTAPAEADQSPLAETDDKRSLDSPDPERRATIPKQRP